MAHDISVLECLWCLDGSWMFLGVTSNFAISLRMHFKTPDMTQITSWRNGIGIEHTASAGFVAF